MPVPARVRPRTPALVLVLLLALLPAVAEVALTTPTATAATAPQLPSGFTRTALPSGQDPYQLTDVAFLPGGGHLTTGKSGRVAWVGPTGTTRTVTTVPSVVDAGDLGLTDITLAPDFATSGRVYTAYSRRAADGHVHARLSTWQLLDPASPTGPSGMTGEQVVLDGIRVDQPYHALTDVAVATDGTLFVAMGDAVASSGDARSHRAQQLGSPYGKLLHVRPDGTGVPSNPWYEAAEPASWRSRTYALGFRSPFRLTLDPLTGTPFVGDVGWTTAEEVNAVRSGGNHGWPCFEGEGRTNGFSDQDACLRLYDGPDRLVPDPPLWHYRHDLPGARSGGSVTGGLFIDNATWPEELQGRYLFGDYSRQALWTLRTDADGRLVEAPEAGDPATSAGTFGSEVGGPTSFVTNPAGEVFYADILTSTVWHLRYTGGNRPPTADGVARTAPGTLRVDLDATASSDQDGDALTYRWDLGEPGTQVLTGATATWTYPDDAERSVTLTVEDPLGEQSVKTLRVKPGNSPPVLTTVGADPPGPYAVGDAITFSAGASDPDEALDPSATTWTVVEEHCPLSACHVHPGTTGAGSTFTVPFTDHGSDTTMRVVARVTDSAGAVTSTTLVARPDLRTVSLSSSPAGVPVQVNGLGSTLPVVVGGQVQVSAPAVSGDLAFRSWDDGSSRTHELVMGTADVSRTATYDRVPLTVQVTTDGGSGPLAAGQDLVVTTTASLAASATTALTALVADVEGCAPLTSAPGQLVPGGTWTATCTTEVTADDLPFPAVHARVTADTAAGTRVAREAGVLAPTGSAAARAYASIGSTGPDGAAVDHALVGDGEVVSMAAGSRLYARDGVGGGVVRGEILTTYLDGGGPTGPLGFPLASETVAAPGAYSLFEGGGLFWTAQTGVLRLPEPVTRAWWSRGGMTKWGRPLAGVEAVPGGSRVRFERGHALWTASRGPFFVEGAILERYVALGGPDALGIPLGDEHDVPGGRASAFPGAALYWSAAVGPKLVRGSILQHYAALGGPARLGLPLGDEEDVPGGRVSRFARGSVYWSPSTPARSVEGGILTHYLRTGGPARWGFPRTDEVGIPGGRVSVMERGEVMWSPATGAHVVEGAILQHLLQTGGTARWGFPLGDEEAVPGGRRSRFQGGSFYWSPSTPARAVEGSILAHYVSRGGPSWIGFPLTDEHATAVGRASTFARGTLEWDRRTGRVALR